MDRKIRELLCRDSSRIDTFFQTFAKNHLSESQTFLILSFLEEEKRLDRDVWSSLTSNCKQLMDHQPPCSPTQVDRLIELHKCLENAYLQALKLNSESIYDVLKGVAGSREFRKVLLHYFSTFFRVLGDYDRAHKTLHRKLFQGGFLCPLYRAFYRYLAFSQLKPAFDVRLYNIFQIGWSNGCRVEEITKRRLS